MKRFTEYFRKLKTAQKVEFIFASVLSLFVLVAVPVYAWFTSKGRLETMTKIKEPNTLDIRTGNIDSIEYFKLKNIDLEAISKNNEPQCYVFCIITGNPETHYNIQLAHTTNIPFTYNIYRATGSSTKTEGAVVEYPPADGSSPIYYSKVGEALTKEDLNADSTNESIAKYGRKLGINDTNDHYYDLTYDDQNDDPQVYAVPIYSKISNLETLNSEHDYFILELGWDQARANTGSGFQKWNEASNLKETDIIYITASKHTG